MNRKRCFSSRLGRVALINLIPLTLVYALCGNFLLEARGGAPPEEATRKSTLQERILQISNGEMIEVRLLNKQKLRGRLGDVTNEGFTLQTARGSKIETQKVAFTDVQSVKRVGGTTGKKIGTGLMFGLAGIGVFFVVAFIVYASGG